MYSNKNREDKLFGKTLINCLEDLSLLELKLELLLPQGLVLLQPISLDKEYMCVLF
jgi:hypothetical protein